MSAGVIVRTLHWDNRACKEAVPPAPPNIRFTRGYSLHSVRRGVIPGQFRVPPTRVKWRWAMEICRNPDKMSRKTRL